MSGSDHLGYSSHPEEELTDFEVRRRHVTWSGRQGVLEVGGVEVPCTVAGEPSWRWHGVDEVAVTVESATTPSALRYTADARLSVVFDDGIELVFVGPIKTAEWAGDHGCVTLISPMIGFEEYRIGGAVFWGAPRGEIGPLVQRFLGRRDVVLDEAARRSGEVTYVICPVDGLEPTTTFLAGQVVFTHDPTLIEALMPTFGDPALLARMSEATCWAVAVISGSLEHASTVQGQRMIDSTLAWLMVVHSLGQSAAGNARGLPYDLSVAIADCPLAASGCPTTATTECGRPERKVVDGAAHGPGVGGRPTLPRGVPRLSRWKARAGRAVFAVS